MAQHQLGSDFSEELSDGTTCSCTASSIDKCSVGGCEMFQEPFYLHPPSARPRDGIYINPMTAFIAETPPKPKDSESFYLHSPHDLVYTRITPLFGDSVTRDAAERKDETLTVKVDVHANGTKNNNHHHHNNNNNNNNNNMTNINNNNNNNNNNNDTINNNNSSHNNVNNNYKPVCNGGPTVRSNMIKDTEHAYEQICLRQVETDSVASSNKKISDNVSDSSNSRKVDRRYSRSSSVSESSNMSSELQGFSSMTSTPSLSRNSSSERIDKTKPVETISERKISVQSTTSDTMKEPRIISNGSSFAKPPPPPPPPPPLEAEEMIVVNSKVLEEVVDYNDKIGGADIRQEKRNEPDVTPTTIKNGVSSKEQTEVDPPVSSRVDIVGEIKPQQVNHHLIGKHMVLPFIPPKFINAADSNTLLKPSEYLKSICKSSGKNTLSKARSVDNLDIQSRQEEETIEPRPEQHNLQPGPPPPPLPPLQKNLNTHDPPSPEAETAKPHQPLATISIQDLTSVQLRRTNTKIHATKTFSAPPPRSVSMTNVSEPFFVQKIDLIAELKMSKDISGIKKLKVERAQVEKSQEQNLISEIHKTYNASKFVDQIPEKDSAGNVIPIWKRQMLARKAAERAKKELEDQIARENEEKRLRSIPAWKRQLLAKKDHVEEKKVNNVNSSGTIVAPAKVVEVTPAPVPLPETILSAVKLKEIGTRETRPKEDKDKEDKSDGEKRFADSNNESHDDNDDDGDDDDDDDDDGPIIPWRAQLRKTNSKLNILD